MRAVVVLSALVLLLAGCAPSNDQGDKRTTGDAQTTPTGTAAPSQAATVGGEPPADDPSLPREDAAGRSPDETVVALNDASRRGDWATVYSLYANATVDFETAAKEWTEADEQYERFAIRETRVESEDRAWVRVTYNVRTTPPGGEPYIVVVDEPGEWWPIHKVDGLWKVQWMPRQ